jgi:uncharacterized protein YdeI (YjbR/CyaY-like superfamily)
MSAKVGPANEPRVTCADRAAWRRWLTENHVKQAQVWLVFFKKHTGKDCIAYRASVEEALCFGWIDGLKRRIDDDRYAYRFTPRKPESKWSPLNIRLAEEAIAEGRMTAAGLKAFKNRKTYDADFLQAREDPDGKPPPEIEKALKASPRAWRNFSQMAPGYRRQYISWLVSAKRPETRARRLEKALRMLEQNEKPGM